MAKTKDEALDADRAAELLSDILAAQTGTMMTAKQITFLIQNHWGRIAPLAHAIHGGVEKDLTKTPAEADANLGWGPADAS